MFDKLANALLGDVVRAAEAPTDAEVRAAYGRGRPPDWLAGNTKLICSFKAQAAHLKPFLNHDQANTELKSAA